jgi:hypothetical protein
MDLSQVFPLLRYDAIQKIISFFKINSILECILIFNKIKNYEKLT